MQQTRAQQNLKRAYELVAQLEQADEETKKIYGGLCHNFPVLVRTAGLCQAVAFSESKKGDVKPRGLAHKHLLEHTAAILGVNNLLETVRESSALEYMHQTRRVLEAFVYFKRFAVSVLKVKGGDDNDDRS